MSNKTLSVVLGSYDRLPYLKCAITSIRRELNGFESAEVIVIDGGSSDGSLSWLAEQKDVITIVQHNRGEWRGKPIERRSWGYFMNLGFKVAQGRFVCMLSDDCLLVPGALSKGVALFEERLAAGDKIGAVAFYWRNWPEQAKYWVGTTAGRRMFVNHGLYLKQALAEVGFADEEHYAFYHADGDLCLRMWDAGWRCIDSPESFVEHFTHANAEVRQSNLDRQRQDWETYLQRWGHLIVPGDPDSVGTWIERAHVDEHRTYRWFPKRGIWALRWRACRRALRG